MAHDDLRPLSPAPRGGLFEEINLFGAPTGVMTRVNRGEALPGAPRGFTWRPLPDVPREELLRRAESVREMANRLEISRAREALFRLATGLEGLAHMGKV
jgi:hypothetical protein